MLKNTVAGKEKMVRILISRGANVNLANHIGWTPIFAAARFGNLFCSHLQTLFQYL